MKQAYQKKNKSNRKPEMKKNHFDKTAEKVVVFLLMVSMVLGLIVFLSMISDRPLSERLVLYSILVVFGIGFGIETAAYKRFKVEHQKIDSQIASATSLPNQGKDESK